MTSISQDETEDEIEQPLPRTVLITGCSSGIGLTCALGMRERGWRVFATARTKQDLEMLNDHGLEALQLDYTKTNTIDTCVTYTLWHTNGELDALFNNGAYGQMGAVEDLSTNVLRAQFEANFFGWHELTRRIIPAMRQQGKGRIVQCSSVLGMISPPYRGAYNASKYALEALTDAMRHELYGTGIHVSLIEPGPIKTRFAEKAIQSLYDNINLQESHHKEIYEQRIAKYAKNNRSFFKLKPQAVLKKLIHALESKKPKTRYYVTAHTYTAAFMKRFLPNSVSDVLIRRS